VTSFEAADAETLTSHGTIVHVSEAFRGMPVRRKSLNARIELQNIKQLVRLAAVQQPNIAFQLYDEASDTELVRVEPSSSAEAAFVQMCGKAAYDTMKPVHGQFGAYSIQGYLSPPSSTACHWSSELQFVTVVADSKRSSSSSRSSSKQQQQQYVRRCGTSVLHQLINDTYTKCFKLLFNRKETDANASSGKQCETFPIFMLTLQSSLNTSGRAATAASTKLTVTANANATVRHVTAAVQSVDGAAAQNAVIDMLLQYLAQYTHAVPGSVLRTLRTQFKHNAEALSPWSKAKAKNFLGNKYSSSSDATEPWLKPSPTDKSKHRKTLANSNSTSNSSSNSSSSKAAGCGSKSSNSHSVTGSSAAGASSSSYSREPLTPQSSAHSGSRYTQHTSTTGHSNGSNIGTTKSSDSNTCNNDDESPHFKGTARHSRTAGIQARANSNSGSNSTWSRLDSNQQYSRQQRHSVKVTRVRSGSNSHNGSDSMLHKQQQQQQSADHANSENSINMFSADIFNFNDLPLGASPPVTYVNSVTINRSDNTTCSNSNDFNDSSNKHSSSSSSINSSNIKHCSHSNSDNSNNSNHSNDDAAYNSIISTTNTNNSNGNNSRYQRRRLHMLPTLSDTTAAMWPSGIDSSTTNGNAYFENLRRERVQLQEQSQQQQQQQQQQQYDVFNDSENMCTSDSYNSSGYSSSGAALVPLPVMQSSTMRVSVKRPRSPTFEFMHADTASYNDRYGYEQQQRQQQQQQCNDTSQIRSGSIGKRVRFQQEIEHIGEAYDTVGTAAGYDCNDSSTVYMMAHHDVASDAMDVQQQLRYDDNCDTADSSTSNTNCTDDSHVQHAVHSNESVKYTSSDTTVRSSTDSNSAINSQLSTQHDGDMSSSIDNSSSATAVSDAIHIVNRKVVTRLNMSIHDDDTSDTEDTICIQAHNYSVKYTVSDSSVNSSNNSSNSRDGSSDNSNSSNNAEDTTTYNDSTTVCKQSVVDNKQTTVSDSIHASSVDDSTTDTAAVGTCSNDSRTQGIMSTTDITQQLATTNYVHQTVSKCSAEQLQAVTADTTASESVLSILLNRAAKCNNLQSQPQTNTAVNDADTTTADATTASTDSDAGTTTTSTEPRVNTATTEQSETTTDQADAADATNSTTDVDREQAAVAVDSADVNEDSNAAVTHTNDVQYDRHTTTANDSASTTDQDVTAHTTDKSYKLKSNDIDSSSHSSDIQYDETIDDDNNDTIEQQWDVLDWSSNEMLSTSKQGHMQLSAEHLSTAAVIGQVDRYTEFYYNYTILYTLYALCCMLLKV
jgi:trimeric autotransporter adhesin